MTAGRAGRTAGIQEESALVPSNIFLMRVPEAYDIYRLAELPQHQLVYRTGREFQRGAKTHWRARPHHIVGHANAKSTSLHNSGSIR
jgi:hypothetical protein